MNDMTTSDGPIGSRPAGETAPGQPSESPLADAPIADAPDLSERLADPAAAPASDDSLDEETLPPAEMDAGDAVPAAPPRPAATDQPPPPEARRLSRGEREVVERTRQHFAACGRCGYLIADLQILLGEAVLHEAMIQARDGWLRLESDWRLRALLSNAYGVRLDLDYDMMDGTCPECRRRFVFATLEDGPARLKLHL